MCVFFKKSHECVRILAFLLPLISTFKKGKRTLISKSQGDSSLEEIQIFLTTANLPVLLHSVNDHWQSQTFGKTSI